MLSVEIDHPFETFQLNARFQAPLNTSTALFGPSGAGKTSILKAIAGLWRPRHCLISIGDDVLTDTDKGVFVPPHKRRFSFVFQDSRLFPHMTVQQNLKYGMNRVGSKTDDTMLSELVSLLGLTDLLSRRPRLLSGGERQRVAIGRALLARPRLMLMDEPLASLDLPRRNEILKLLEQVRDSQRTPMIYVSHTPTEVARLTDQMVLLSAGTCVAAGPTPEVIGRLDLVPFTGQNDPGAILIGIVSDNDPSSHMSRVTFDGGELRLPMEPRPTGSVVRLRVPARDVLIATKRPEAISANNIIEGQVLEINAAGPGEVDLAIGCGASRVLARITNDSCARLGLRPGARVYAIIKSVTVDGR